MPCSAQGYLLCPGHPIEEEISSRIRGRLVTLRMDRLGSKAISMENHPPSARGPGSLIDLEIIFLDIARSENMLFSGDTTTAMARRANTTRAVILNLFAIPPLGSRLPVVTHLWGFESLILVYRILPTNSQCHPLAGYPRRNAIFFIV